MNASEFQAGASCARNRRVPHSRVRFYRLTNNNNCLVRNKHAETSTVLFSIGVHYCGRATLPLKMLRPVSTVVKCGARLTSVRSHLQQDLIHFFWTNEPDLVTIGSWDFN